jgi:glutamine synthetase
MLNFTEKEEIVNFISERGIKILNLCHIPEDGRLKTLSFSANDKRRVYEILEFGERVDGSSLFSFIEPGKSDIYIQPQLNRTFINPFSQISTLNILCDYLDENGKLLEISPKSVLVRAEEKLRSSTWVMLKALAELEFYIISKQKTETLFLSVQDKNYHESTPLTEFENLRNEVLAVLTDIGIAIKYGHSEVGRILTKDGTLMEQHEIELMPQNLVEMAETIAIAKWVIRNICARHGVSASFSPKILLEHAGNGMHIHLCGLKNGKNITANPNGTLSTETLKMIGGILRFASSLTAFGNPTPASYFRFIARKESPTHICWSYRNRLALIRIPLWWSFKKKTEEMNNCRETFEYRGPDPLANPYLLFAGLAIAAKYGFENPKEAIQIAENLHVEETARRKRLKNLPRSCNESAKNLRKDRKFYEADNVFPKILINKTIDKLKAYKDKDLWKNLADKPEKIENLLKQYLHQG